MTSAAVMRFLVYCVASLAVDATIVAVFLWFSDGITLQSMVFGIVFVWAVRLAVGLRNTVARAVYYLLDHDSIINRLVQHMRQKEYPRDVFAYNWFSYFSGAVADEDLPRNTLASIATTNGEMSGMKQASIIQGAIFEHLLDKAVERYLA